MSEHLGELIEVNDDNYFTKTGHFSNSFIKSWNTCAFSTTCRDNTFNKNFFIGHYVEALICGDDASKVLNREDYKEHVNKAGGDPYKWVTDCDVYSNRVLKDKEFMKYINHPASKTQVILTGVIGGLNFKCAIDLLNLEGLTSTSKMPFILDLKTTKDGLKKSVWVEREGRNKKVSFIEAWGYHYQLAIYRELVRQNYDVVCDVFIGAIQKTLPTNFDIIDLTPAFDFDFLLKEVEVMAKKVDYEIKMNIVSKCGTCDDCVSAKKTKGAISYEEHLAGLE